MNKNKGFTLVEMAVVLVVIGLIISAVSVGQNLQRNAEVQKLKQTFIDQWVMAYNQYYNRTGVVLGDSEQEPRYMVAGKEFEYVGIRQQNAGGAGVPGVEGSDIRLPETLPRICEGAGHTRIGMDDDRALAAQSLHDLMDRQGIRMPAARSEGREDRFVYLDSNGNPQEVQVCFQWNPEGQVHGSGNVMVLRGLTPELAREFDRMIDGKADAIEGMFRQYNPNSNSLTTSGESGREWLGNNTYAMNDQVVESREGLNRDEDAVMLVTAVYKMEQ